MSVSASGCPWVNASTSWPATKFVIVMVALAIGAFLMIGAITVFMQSRTTFRLTESIARFGQLYLQKGKWQGRQLVPAAWVEAATARQVLGAGLAGQRLQPADLRQHAIAHQAVLAEDFAQLDGFLGVAAVDGGDGGQRSQVHERCRWAWRACVDRR